MNKCFFSCILIASMLLETACGMYTSDPIAEGQSNTDTVYSYDEAVEPRYGSSTINEQESVRVPHGETVTYHSEGADGTYTNLEDELTTVRYVYHFEKSDNYALSTDSIEISVLDDETFMKQWEEYKNGEFDIDQIDKSKIKDPIVLAGGVPVFFFEETLEIKMKDYGYYIIRSDVERFNYKNEPVDDGVVWGDTIWCYCYATEKGDYYSVSNGREPYIDYYSDCYNDGDYTAKEFAEKMEDLGMITIVDEEIIKEAEGQGYDAATYYHRKQFLKDRQNRTDSDDQEEIENNADEDGYDRLLGGVDYEFSGDISWTDGTNVFPAKGVKCIISLYESAGSLFPTLRRTVYSDNAGHYSVEGSLSIPESFSGTVNVQLSCQDGLIEVTERDFGDIDYQFQKNASVSNHTLVKYLGNLTFDPDTGLQDERELFSQLLEIHQAARYALSYAQTGFGYYPSDIIYIVYDAEGNISDNYYSPSDDTIYIKEYNYGSWDTIAHEFFHKMNSDIELLSCGNVGGKHIPGWSLNDVTLSGTYTKRQACQLAWSEGAANYFAISSQNNCHDGGSGSEYSGLICRYYKTVSNQLIQIDYPFGDEKYKDFTEISLQCNEHYGEAYEGEVMAYLYRLPDYLHNGTREMVNNYLLESHSATLSDFISYIYTHYDRLLFDKYDDQTTPLLTDLELSSNTSFFSIPLYRIGRENPYMMPDTRLYWTVGNGGSSKANNHICLMIYNDRLMVQPVQTMDFYPSTTASNESFTDFSCAYLRTPSYHSGNVTRIGLLTSQNLRDLAILQQAGFLYWQVEEYNEYTDSDGFCQTGPFPSKTGRINFSKSLVYKPRLEGRVTYDSHSGRMVNKIYSEIYGLADKCEIYLSASPNGTYSLYDVLDCVRGDSQSYFSVLPYTVIDNLQSDTKYYLKTRFYNQQRGLYSPFSEPFEMVGLFSTINVSSIEKQGDTYSFSWNPVTGADSYNVYYNEGGFSGPNDRSQILSGLTSTGFTWTIPDTAYEGNLTFYIQTIGSLTSDTGVVTIDVNSTDVIESYQTYNLNYSPPLGEDELEEEDQVCPINGISDEFNQPLIEPGYEDLLQWYRDQGIDIDEALAANSAA